MPKTDCGVHFSDEVTDFLRHTWSTDPPSAAPPIPVEPEPFAMQADDGLGLDQHEGLAPFGPEANEGYPQEPVPCAKRDALLPARLENDELVPEGEDLDLEGGTCS
jgi:hypothetical protein